jgi:hypothetical protein
MIVTGLFHQLTFRNSPNMLPTCAPPNTSFAKRPPPRTIIYLNAMRTAQTPLIVTAIFLPTFPPPDVLKAIDDLSPNESFESKRESSEQRLTHRFLWLYQLSQIWLLGPRSNLGSTRVRRKDRLPYSLPQYWEEQPPQQMFGEVLRKRPKETEHRFPGN